jgi:hypothetical protein
VLQELSSIVAEDDQAVLFHPQLESGLHGI